MKNIYRQLLTKEIEMSDAMHELIESLMKELYGEDHLTAFHAFENMVNNYEEYGFIGDVGYFKTQIEDQKKRHAEWLVKNKKVTEESK